MNMMMMMMMKRGVFPKILSSPGNIKRIVISPEITVKGTA